MMKDVIGPDGKQVSVANYLRYGTFHKDIYSRVDTDRFLVDVSEDVYINEIASFLDLELLPKSDDTFDLLAN